MAFPNDVGMCSNREHTNRDIAQLYPFWRGREKARLRKHEIRLATENTSFKFLWKQDV